MKAMLMDMAVDFELLGSKAKMAVIEAAPTTCMWKAL